MNLNPTTPDPAQRPGAHRLRRAGHEPPARPAGTPSHPIETDPSDAIEISPEARELQGALHGAQDRAAADELDLPPERLREILDRIKQGFYEQPQVREALLRRLAADLGIEDIG